MHVHTPGVCAAMHDQECMGNEYCIAENFVEETFANFADRLRLMKFSTQTFLFIIKHTVHSQRLYT